MLSFALSFCAAAAFASNAHSASQEPLPYKKAMHLTEHTDIVSKPFSNTCTVTVSFGKISSTFTATCECTLKEACNAAYKMATMLIKA